LFKFPKNKLEVTKFAVLGTHEMTLTMDNRIKVLHVGWWLTALNRQSVFNLFPEIVVMNPSLVVAHSQDWQLLGCAILVRVEEPRENQSVGIKLKLNMDRQHLVQCFSSLAKWILVLLLYNQRFYLLPEVGNRSVVSNFIFTSHIQIWVPRLPWCSWTQIRVTEAIGTQTEQGRIFKGTFLTLTVVVWID